MLIITVHFIVCVSGLTFVLCIKTFTYLPTLTHSLTDRQADRQTVSD